MFVILGQGFERLLKNQTLLKLLRCLALFIRQWLNLYCEIGLEYHNISYVYFESICFTVRRWSWLSIGVSISLPRVQIPVSHEWFVLFRCCWLITCIVLVVTIRMKLKHSHIEIIKIRKIRTPYPPRRTKKKDEREEEL